MSIVIKVLKDAIDTASAQCDQIAFKIKALAEDAHIIRAERGDLILELQKLCPHPSTSRVNGTYMSGGYDHVSEQPYTIVCDECNKILESKLIRGTYA